MCTEMAKYGQQQLMAFPCIQMRNFDREGGHVWIAEEEAKVGGFGLSVARRICILKEEWEGGSVVTSMESKGLSL